MIMVSILVVSTVVAALHRHSTSPESIALERLDLLTSRSFIMSAIAREVLRMIQSYGGHQLNSTINRDGLVEWVGSYR